MLKNAFGHLLTIDLYGCDKELCDDVSYCYKFLEELVDKLKMNKQSPPFIFKSDEITYPDKAGISGWVPLIESGIQIHTLTVKGFISIDIYSCGTFCNDGICEFVKEFFKAEEVEENYILRGVKYHSIEK